MIEGPIQQPALRTRRLILRAPESRDAAPMQTLAADRRVAEMTLNIPHPYPDGAAEAWLQQRWQGLHDGTAATFALAVPEENAADPVAADTFIGAVGLAINARHSRAEIGYWVGVPYWNRGYVTEACVAVIEWAFQSLKLVRIEARHYPANAASGRVMQKLGMQFEGVQRSYTQRDGIFRDSVIYALINSDR